jgi:hypothetical protein
MFFRSEGLKLTALERLFESGLKFSIGALIITPAIPESFLSLIDVHVSLSNRNRYGFHQIISIFLLPAFEPGQILASILRELDYEASAGYRSSPHYLRTICGLSDYFLLIDEANDLDRRVWPYLKRIIDARVPIVFAGLPKVRTFLTSEHPDILSRLKTLILYPIEVEDFILEHKDFESEAIEQIYAFVKGDMRKFDEILTDCREKAKELKHSFVDVNLVLSLLSETQHP